MAKLIEITGKAISGEWGTDDLDGTGIPVLRTTNFTSEGVVNYNDVVTRQIKKKNLSEKMLRYGDIILEKSGGSDKQPVGRVVFFEGEDNKYLFNNFTGLLRVQETQKWIPKYVFYALFANYVNGGTLLFENKTTGLHNLQTDSYVSSVEIVDRNIEEQSKIVKNLDKLNSLIASRREQLAKLDELVKSRFVELFGELFYGDSKHYTVPEIAYVYIGLVTTMTKHYVDKGTPLIFNSTIKDNRFEFKERIYLDDEFATANAHRKHKLNDVVTVHTGDVGTSAIIGPELDGSLGFATIVSRINDMNFVRPAYLCDFFNSNLCKDQLTLMIRGDRNNLNLKEFNQVLLTIPPIEQQLEWEQFRKQTDKSKLVIQESLEKLETLKKALMQKYFG